MLYRLHHWLAAALLVLHASLTHAIQPLDSIAVIVNDDVITLSEFERRVEYYYRQIRLSGGSVSDVDSLKKQVLERMIRDKVQMQKATLLGIQIDDILLNRTLDAMANKNNLTLDQLRQTLQSEGIDFAEFREQSREELIIQQLQQRMVADKVLVTEQEVRQFIENNLQQDNTNTEYELRHILVATPESADPDSIEKARQKAERLYRQITEGADFAELAIRESDGSRALQGGDLGTRSATELPELFLNALQGLKNGETSRPVKSASGFHLLQLVKSSSNKEIVTQTHARHILIKTDDETGDDKAREILVNLRQRVIDGEDFADLANEYSDDPGSRIKGGDLGWASPGSFVPAFENTMNRLQKTEISEPFRSQFGWHILQVLDRREHDQTTALLEAKAQQSIRQRKIDEELRLWLRRIRDEAYVDYVHPNVVSLAGVSE